MAMIYDNINSQEFRDVVEDYVQKERRKRALISYGCKGLGIAIILVIILMCIPLIIPQFLGYAPYSVTDESMEPMIPKGSLVYVKSANASIVAPGDIIISSDSENGGLMECHRVAENKLRDGQLVTDKATGSREEQTTLEYTQYVGTVAKIVPHLGIILSVATSMFGIIAIGILVVVAILLFFLGERIVPNPDKYKKN